MLKSFYLKYPYTFPKGEIEVYPLKIVGIFQLTAPAPYFCSGQGRYEQTEIKKKI